MTNKDLLAAIGEKAGDWGCDGCSNYPNLCRSIKEARDVAREAVDKLYLLDVYGNADRWLAEVEASNSWLTEEVEE